MAIPEQIKIGQFKQLAHGLKSGDVTIIDKKRIRIANIYYDGQGPGNTFIFNR